MARTARDPGVLLAEAKAALRARAGADTPAVITVPVFIDDDPAALAVHFESIDGRWPPIVRNGEVAPLVVRVENLCPRPAGEPLRFPPPPWAIIRADGTVAGSRPPPSRSPNLDAAILGSKPPASASPFTHGGGRASAPPGPAAGGRGSPPVDPSPGFDPGPDPFVLGYPQTTPPGVPTHAPGSRPQAHGSTPGVPRPQAHGPTPGAPGVPTPSPASSARHFPTPSDREPTAKRPAEMLSLVGDPPRPVN